MTLTFRARPGNLRQLELGDFSLDQLLGLSLDAVARFEIEASRGVLGDWFEIHGATDQPRWVFEGTGNWLDGLGTEFCQGELIIDGDVGRRVARRARGGEIVVYGATGSWAGSGMRGGTLSIAGNSGDFLGGPLRGERGGMRGGVIFVGGDCGSEVGHRLRRGTMIVAGSVGPRGAWEMIAGTLVVGGAVGTDVGFAMRRGTIMLLAESVLAVAGPSDPQRGQQWTGGSSVPHEFFPLLVRAIRAQWARGIERCVRELPSVAACPLEPSESPRGWLRRVGDRRVGGLGELLSRAVR